MPGTVLQAAEIVPRPGETGHDATAIVAVVGSGDDDTRSSLHHAAGLRADPIF